MSSAGIVELSVRRRGVVLAIWAAVLGFALLVYHASCRSTPSPTSPTPRSRCSRRAPGLSPARGRAVPDLPDRDGDERRPGPRRDPVDQPHRRLGRHRHLPGRHRLWFARQLVSERLKLAETDIPPGYGRPELAPVSTGLGEIYEFYLTSKRHSPDGAAHAARLGGGATSCASVPGVVEVNGMGGEAKQYQVVLDPKRLAGYRLSLQRRAERRSSSNNAAIGGGYIEKNGESYRHPRRGAVPQRRGHREHRASPPTTTARRCCSGTWATVRIGAALRFGVGHQARRGRDRRRHGDDADRRELARGGRRREGASWPRSRRELPGGRRDPQLLRPRRVHRAHAEDGRHQPGRGRRAGRRRPVPDARAASAAR